MNNKNLWTVIGVVAAVLIVAGIWYWQTQKSPAQSLLEEQENVENLQQGLEQATNPAIEVPSANPLDKAIPDVNPIEKANPFKNIKTNPFE